MADDEKPPPRVVKRVVRKAVATTPEQPLRPSVRYGRQVTTTKPRPTPARPVRTRPARQRPAVGRKVAAAGKKVGSGGAGAAAGLARTVQHASVAVAATTARRGRRILAWRIPHIDPLPAAIVTGLVIGLVSAGLGFGALAAFSEVRGVASGGGRWGSLTFVVVSFVAFVLGELLLSAFGSARARLTGFLGVVLTIVALLGLFLEVADSRWGLAVVPLLGAAMFAVAHALLELAEKAPTLSD